MKLHWEETDPTNWQKNKFVLVMEVTDEEKTNWYKDLHEDPEPFEFSMPECMPREKDDAA